MSNGQNLLEEIDGFLNAVEATKAAESASAAGRVQNQGDASTAHPSKGVDDGTQNAPEGARSAENTADVKSDVPGQPVDAAKEDKMEGQSENPLTTAKPTGEDPANETSSVDGLIGGEAGKDHQGKDTKHPAKVDFGGKYASATPGEVKVAAVSLMAQVNEFNAQVAALNVGTAKEPGGTAKQAVEKSAAGPPADPPPAENPPAETPPVKTKEANAPDPDEEAGKKAAEVAAAGLGLTGPSAELVHDMAKEAIADANRVVEFCTGLQTGADEVTQEKRVKTARAGAVKMHTVVKQAIGDEMAGADTMAYGGEGEQPGAVGEGAGAGAGAEPGGLASGELEQIIAELQAAGIDPEILAQIDPADLAQALAEAEGGGGGMPGGGMPGGGMMGEEPPMEEGPAPEMAPAAVM